MYSLNIYYFKMENTLETTIEIINEDVKITKQPRIRSEKQKENDIKLKDKLIQYHKKKREAKIESLKMKEIIDAFIEIESDTENLIKLEEQEIQKLKEEMRNNEPVEIIKVKKGRPKKIKPSSNDEKEFHIFPGPEKPKEDEICCSSN